MEISSEQTPENTPSPFDQLSQDSSDALNQRRLEDAIDLCDRALTLVEADTDKWAMIMQRKAIAASMNTGHEGAQTLFDQVLEYADSQEDDTRSGDVRRDIALSFLRGEVSEENIEQAEIYIATAEEFHADDNNRTAALFGARGRLNYARGVLAHDEGAAIQHFIHAVEYHYEADYIWEDDPESADKQWIFNNLPHLQKALARLGREQEVKEVGLRIIKLNKEHGTLEHEERARKLMQGGAKKLRPWPKDARRRIADVKPRESMKDLF